MTKLAVNSYQSKLGVIEALESVFGLFARRTGSSGGERVDGSCNR